MDRYCSLHIYFSALLLISKWNNQVGGWTQEYAGLTFVNVRGAGHEVPLHRPKLALTLIKAFLAGTSMPNLEPLAAASWYDSFKFMVVTLPFVFVFHWIFVNNILPSSAMIAQFILIGNAQTVICIFFKKH